MFHSLMKFYCVLSSYSLVCIFLLGALVVLCLATKVRGLCFKVQFACGKHLYH